MTSNGSKIHSHETNLCDPGMVFFGVLATPPPVIRPSWGQRTHMDMWSTTTSNMARLDPHFPEPDVLMSPSIRKDRRVVTLRRLRPDSWTEPFGRAFACPKTWHAHDQNLTHKQLLVNGWCGYGVLSLLMLLAMCTLTLLNWLDWIFKDQLQCR